MPLLLRPGAALGKRRAPRICRNGLNALLAVTLAPRCAACGSTLDAPLDGPVCPFCWDLVQRLIPPVCRTCGDPLASWRVISVALEQCPRCRRYPASNLVCAARAAGEYDGTLREILHAFKYEGRRTLADRLSTLMRNAGVDLLTGADCVVPVPLHPWRRMHRGFNQAEELGRRLGLPVVHALWRVRATSPQTGLHASARRRNVSGAFRLSPLLSKERRQRLPGSVIVLVDDVRTTGATLNACARVLTDAGAREVRALTVARARPPARRPASIHGRS